MSKEREVGANTPAELLQEWLKEYVQKIGLEYLDDERKRKLATNIIRIAYELNQQAEMSDWGWNQIRAWCQLYLNPSPQPINA